MTGTVLTVVTVASGTLAVGMVITGPGIVLQNTYITSLGTGTGGAGTYNLNQTVTTMSTAQAIYGQLGTMTVSAVSSGTLSSGQYITYAAVASGSALFNNTLIVALGTGAGSTGTYFVYPAQTVASSTMYGGGIVTTTVDNYEATRIVGGNQIQRNTPLYEDTQGSILSKRMMGVYATKTSGSSTAPLYYFANLYTQNNITLNSAQQVGRIVALLSFNPGSAFSPAFGSAYGNLVAPVGVSFVSGTSTDIQNYTIGSSIRWTDTTNAAVFGYTNQGPRIVVQNRRLSADLTPNAIDIVADHTTVVGSFGIPTPTTITSTPTGIADNITNVIMNVAGTATVTLPTNGSYFVATWDNGAGAAGTTLTVTTMSSGTPLYVGCRIMVGYGGIAGAATATITALGTGTGGTGTYTLSVSAYYPSCEMNTPTVPAGKLIYIKTYTSNAVNSSASIIIPLIGGTASTAILPATAGKWALLQWNGSSYEILQSN